MKQGRRLGWRRCFLFRFAAECLLSECTVRMPACLLPANARLFHYALRSSIHPYLIAMSALLSSLALPAFPQENPLGEFAGHTDVGSPKLSGSAGYDAALQEYTLTGAGSNMWAGRDEFQFVWKKMTGDFILRTRAEFIGQGAVDHRKIGWMVRPSLEADAPYADCARHGVKLTSLQFRRSPGRRFGTNRPAHHQCRCPPVREERRGFHLFRRPLRRAFRLRPTHQPGPG